MDRIPDKETMKLIGKHISFLKKKFAPERIILFGSRARGDNLKESDIDLLVVSEKFADIPFRERMIEAYGMWDKKQDLEQICYTAAELNEMSKRIGIVKTALSEGIELT
jgi:uncharacterized protein